MYIGKKQKILVAVLAFALFLTIGYSLFSQNIKISGTAQAQGSFDLSLTCQPGFSNDIVDAMGVSTNEMQSGYADESCIPSGSAVTMSTNLLYPGSSRYFTVTITNTGTIDAVLPTSYDDGKTYKMTQTVEVYNNSNDAKVKTFNSSPSVSFSNDAYKYPHFISFGDGSLVLAKNLDGDVSTEFNDLSMMVKDDSGDSYFRLKPGESALVVLLIEWPSDATDKETYSKVTGTVTLPFEQATMYMEDTTDGETCFNGC